MTTNKMRLAGTITSAADTGLAGGTIRFICTSTYYNILNTLVTDYSISSSGSYDFTVNYGTYTVQIRKESDRNFSTVCSNVVVASLGPWTIEQLIVEQPNIELINPDLIEQMGVLLVKATQAAALSKDWANKAEDQKVDSTEYSSKHYAAKSAKSATASANSATQAAASKAAAETASSAAQVAKEASETARDQAVSAKNSAEVSNTQAQSAKDAAEASNTSAQNAKAAAAVSEANALSSKNAAAASASAAAGSANTANIANTNAQTAKSGAEAARDKAQKWADEAVDVPVEPSKFSAKHYATKASTSATQSESSRAAAELAETAAEAARDQAVSANTSAQAAKTAAESARDQSVTAKNQSVTAKTASELARDQAVAAKDLAEQAAASTTGSIIENGNVDLSSGTPPSPIVINSVKRATLWKVTVGGVIDGVQYGVGDSIVYSAQTDSYFKIDSTDSVTSVAGKTGVVTLDKNDVKLGNVDNTSDINKPVSTAQASAISQAISAHKQESNAHTPQSVGALSATDEAVWKSRGGFSDLNGGNRFRPGYFWYSSGTANAPTSDYGHGFTVGNGMDAGQEVWGSQVAFSHQNKVFFRNAINTSMSAPWIRFYTTSDKPTPLEIGAVNRAGDNITGRLISTSGFDMGEACSVHISDVDRGFRISANPSGYSELVRTGAGKVAEWSYGLRAYGNDDWRIGSDRIYHQGFKPTANDVGALSTNGGTFSGVMNGTSNIQFQGPPMGGIDLDTILTETTGQWGYGIVSTASTNCFPVSNNANGVLSFNTHTGKFGRQFGFSSNGAVYTRFRDGTNYSAWRKVYDEGNKPSYTELGVVSATEHQDVYGIKKFIGSIAFNNSDSFNVFNYGGNAITLQGKDNAWLNYRFGGAGTLSGISISDYDTQNISFYKNGDIYSNGVFVLGSTPAQSSAQAQIFHNGKGSSGTPINIRSMRESGNATWIWEKVSNGNIFYSTGVHGGGSTRINFNVTAGTGQAVGGFTTGSDARFKENITYVSGSPGATTYLDKVCSLSPAWFNYIGVDTVRFGLIAQDVEREIPEAVESHNMGADGVSENRLFIDSLAITAAHNEAIKELRWIVDAQKSEIESLRSAIAALR